MNKSIFIVSGLLSAIGIGLFTFTILTNELHKKGKRGDVGTIQTFKNDLKKLQNFQREGHDQNPDLIESYDKQTKAYKTEIVQIKKELREKNNNLNDFFSSAHKTNASRFQGTYIKEMKNLSDQFIKKCGANSIKDKSEISRSLAQVSLLQKWGGQTPPAADLVPAMKQFNILSNLYDSLESVGIYSLDSVRITISTTAPRGNDKNKISNPLYTLIPVSIVCQIEMKRLTELVSSVLRNDNLAFQIESISAESADNSINLIGKQPLKNGLKVTLNMSVLEFTHNKIAPPPKKKKRRKNK